ncbi:MAG TPA: TadE/TadG family type IV pilus assembly protein [Pyrinomonadaceae bacterium]|nr:TadE/TadG family type IV pilus assembly protein [Pyrinomonadaceae bacterium]
MHTRIRRIRSRRRLRRMLQLHRFGRDERGVQLVEAAIVVPIFLMLFAATAEFGRYFYEYTTLAKGAQVGARYLSSAPTEAAEDTKAKNLVVYGNEAGSGTPILPGLSTSQVVITRQGPITLIPETVTIQIVGYQHQPIFNVGALTKSTGLSLNVDVKPSVTMRYLLTQPPPI